MDIYLLSMRFACNTKEPHPNHNDRGKPERIQGSVQLEHIEAIEKSLWNAADTLRSNSNYDSNEYFMPVMGLIFLRHAYSTHA